MTRQRIKGTPQALPHAPAEWDVADAGALQALQRGDATQVQQQRALKFIVEQLACTYDLSYRPTGGTEFAEGKRFVGLQIVKLLHVNLSKLSRSQEQLLPP